MGVQDLFKHEDVEGLRVGRFRLGLTSACIVYRLGNLVIDTGPANQWRQVRAFLSERRVDRALITHHHEDHGGNGARLHQAGTRVLAPDHARPPLAGGFPLRAYQRWIWGTPARFEAEPLPDSIEEGSWRLQPVAAPGHSTDMTCYLEPNRGWLFSGDLYIAARPRYLRADEDLTNELTSLRAMLALDFETLFCAHRGPLTDGRRHLHNKLNYLEDLQGQVRRLQKEGLDARAITRRLLGREDLMTLITGHHFAKHHLVRACMHP